MEELEASCVAGGNVTYVTSVENSDVFPQDNSTQNYHRTKQFALGIYSKQPKSNFKQILVHKYSLQQYWNNRKVETMEMS